MYWGDLVFKQKPIIRRVLFGIEAHLTMYFYVYIQDFLRFNLLLQYVHSKNIKNSNDLTFLEDFNKDYKSLYPDLFNGGGIQEGEFTNILLSDICMGSGKRIVELGSTVGTSIVKFKIIRYLKNKSFDFHLVGIENSSVLGYLSNFLHGNDIKIIKSYKNLEPFGNSHLLSRFVASYVFNSGNDFAEWLIKNFDSFVIEDAFSLNQDIRVFNHGLPETYMDFKTFQHSLSKSGFQLYIEHVYIDYPAKSNQCFVMRIIGTKDVDFAQKNQDSFNFANVIQVDPNDPFKFLDGLRTDRNYLKNVKHNKSAFPVWSETPGSYSRFKQSLAYIKNRFKVRTYPSNLRIGRHIASSLKSYLDKL